jgi:peptide-methionine (S)-S-oxide reductase
MKEIVLAGGCFWGVEEYFSRIKGVHKTTVGYANGSTIDPTYEEVCSGTTNHVEAVYIQFDEFELPLLKLLDFYWQIVDPTVMNRQGPDKGTQYRTGIYHYSEEDAQLIQESLANEQNRYSEPIVTETMPLKSFFNAEAYHQSYLKKNPNGYCHIKLN